MSDYCLLLIFVFVFSYIITGILMKRYASPPCSAEVTRKIKNQYIRIVELVTAIEEHKKHVEHLCECSMSNPSLVDIKLHSVLEE